MLETNLLKRSIYSSFLVVIGLMFNQSLAAETWRSDLNSEHRTFVRTLITEGIIITEWSTDGRARQLLLKYQNQLFVCEVDIESPAFEKAAYITCKDLNP